MPVGLRGEKICSRCGILRPSKLFVGRSRVCGPCKLIAKVWPPPPPFKRRAESRAEIREKVRNILRTSLCVDCGERRPTALQFDHVTSKKSNAISRMVYSGAPWSVISDELRKCVVRCANCHQMRTAKVGGGFYE